MIPAQLPDNEPARIKELHKLLILDTPPEQRFDRIITFLADEFTMPIAMISLVDSNRQWFKARLGMTCAETDRNISFCAHAILGTELFIVPDAQQDGRFSDNPLVTDVPFVRFYAGAPLIMNSGHVIGTLCMLDYTPRSLDPLDMAIFCAVRNIVVDEIELSAKNIISAP